MKTVQEHILQQEWQAILKDDGPTLPGLPASRDARTNCSLPRTFGVAHFRRCRWNMAGPAIDLERL